ncbi:hypothetical protein KC19_2G164300 [Ceratodon purpureus]|uniref:TNFR-Cys domain-containing protein n=1 Tax=Ceratodon purpureus TaxID=3225 RepID=A0A8T0IUL8_CERPU|nr:hypothetical protein KC19_2G164300 [Ceratodon purpureus]
MRATPLHLLSSYCPPRSSLLVLVFLQPSSPAFDFIAPVQTHPAPLSEMSTSQQWRHAGLMVAVAMVVLFIGSADAWGCPSGFKNCDPYKPGCETCIKNDVNNCGDCKKQCKDLPYTTKKCADGKCVYSCKPGWADCDKNMWSNGCEKDLGKDTANCGSCYNKCKVTLKGGEATCSGGKCGQQCKKGTKFDKTKNCCVPVKAY